MATPTAGDVGVPPSSGAIVRNTGMTLAASGVVLLLVAAANVLIGRLLGVEGQGQVAAATLLPMIVAYGGELGLPIATGYQINRDPASRDEIVATARCVALMMTLLLTAVAVALIAVLPLPGEAKPVSFVFCLFVGLNLFYRLHLTVLQAELRMTPFNAIRVAGAASYLGILLLLAATRTASILGVVVALLVANGVWCASSMLCTFSRPLLRREGRRTRALFRYGLPAHLGNVSAVDGLKLDQLVLALFLSTGQLGLYVAAMTIIIGNRVIGQSVGMVCFPLASRGEGPRSPGAPRQLRRLLTVTLVVALAVALFEVRFSRELLIAVFGNRFAPAASALRVLAIGSVFMNVRQPCAEWLRGCGRPEIVARAEVLGVTCLLVLSAVLWNGSIVRVAWIVSISSIVSFAVLPGSVLGTFRGHDGDPMTPAIR